MNTQIRRLALGLIALYIALFVTLNYWQVGQRDALADQPDNTRQLLREFDKPRGPIVSADGVTAAQSFPAPAGSDVDFQREYPTNDLFAHVTGYHTFGLGSTQVERTESEVLTGSTAEQELRGLPSALAGNPDNSGTVQLTVRRDLQEAAKFLLGEREGTIVMLEPATGKVLAMWSWPSFDPNAVAGPDYDAAFDALSALQEAPGDPLLANTYQQRYMPGSTFKIITTGIGLETGVLTLDSTFPVETEWVPPQTTDPIGNYNGTACGGNLTEVFARSCNIPFAKTAVLIGPERFVAGAEAWGIGEPIPIDIPRPAASTLGTTDYEDNIPLLAIAGFGQGEVQMVPMHMAMAAAAVANGGQMMKPYVVDARIDHSGTVLDRTDPEVWKTPLSPANAQIMTDLMIQVAQVGTASCCIALDSGLPVAAKTGTAQLNSPGQEERSHAWITAFAPADAPRYAVAVMIEGTNAEISASTGGRLAGPIAKAMLDIAIASEQQP